MDTATATMAFLHDCALDKRRALSVEEQTIANKTNALLKNADAVIICLGGKAGRLGECVVGTGLLEGALQALCYLGKAGTPVSIIVDEGVGELFDERLYQEKYWSKITVIALAQAAAVQEVARQEAGGKNVLVLDFHGANDGMPYLQCVESTESSEDPEEHAGTISLFLHLFRVGLRSYAQRGTERRYADFIEEVFALPEGAIDGQQAQPGILLSPEDHERYSELVEEYGLDAEALQVICFFQSVVPAKCYERWDEVLYLLCAYFAEHFPGQKLDFLLACGPDGELPRGIRRADLEEWLQDFTGVEANAREVISSTPSLRELAILTSRSVLALSNDTGPGHIAGALDVPTITPYLPGNIYSRQVWSSTPWHRGVTLEPNPYSFEQLQSAVIWGNTDIINSIEPRALFDQILASLPASFQKVQEE